MEVWYGLLDHHCEAHPDDAPDCCFDRQNNLLPAVGHKPHKPALCIDSAPVGRPPVATLLRELVNDTVPSQVYFVHVTVRTSHRCLHDSLCSSALPGGVTSLTASSQGTPQTEVLRNQWPQPKVKNRRQGHIQPPEQRLHSIKSITHRTKPSQHTAARLHVHTESPVPGQCTRFTARVVPASAAQATPYREQ